MPINRSSPEILAQTLVPSLSTRRRTFFRPAGHVHLHPSTATCRRLIRPRPCPTSPARRARVGPPRGPAAPPPAPASSSHPAPPLRRATASPPAGRAATRRRRRPRRRGRRRPRPPRAAPPPPRRTSSPAMHLANLGNCAAATVPPGQIWIQFSDQLTFCPETLIILLCSSHHNSTSVAPIHACSISKCSSRRLHHFISLHHSHLSSP